jgi:16S rRNA (guanine527-N7)-methyltransferase
VKRKSADSIVDPHQIAKAVRSQVEAFLHGVPDALSPEFPERIEKLAQNVALWGSKMNLTAHPEDPEEIAFHVIDSVMPVVLAMEESSMLRGEFAHGRRILDLGSGAGFPGLVLAAVSSADFTLVESRRKRASFLQVAVAEMSLKNVTIEGRRAEDIGFAGQYHLVTARAFGDAADFFALAARALKPGGLAILYANPSQRLSLEAHQLIEYSVTRRGEKIDRILAIWRRLVD